MTASSQEERLCEIGAAALTMPAARFIPFLASRPLSLAAIRACSVEFAVSTTASGRHAMDLTDASACLFVCEMARTKNQTRFHIGTPALPVTHWWASTSWPFPGSHLNLPVSQESVIADAYTHRDHRSVRGVLGIPFHPGTYDIDAQGGCTYPPRRGSQHVLALAIGPLGE